MLDTDALVRDFIGVPMVVARDAGPFTFNSAGGPVTVLHGPLRRASSSTRTGSPATARCCRCARSRSPPRATSTTLNIQEQGVLERATQKRDGANQPLWFDTGGGETTDCGQDRHPGARRGRRGRSTSTSGSTRSSTQLGPRTSSPTARFGDYVPSGDTGGGWTSSNVDETAGGWTLRRHVHPQLQRRGDEPDADAIARRDPGGRGVPASAGASRSTPAAPRTPRPASSSRWRAPR